MPGAWPARGDRRARHHLGCSTESAPRLHVPRARSQLCLWITDIRATNVACFVLGTGDTPTGHRDGPARCAGTGSCPRRRRRPGPVWLGWPFCAGSGSPGRGGTGKSRRDVAHAGGRAPPRRVGLGWTRRMRLGPGHRSVQVPGGGVRGGRLRGVVLGLPQLGHGGGEGDQVRDQRDRGERAVPREVAGQGDEPGGAAELVTVTGAAGSWVLAPAVSPSPYSRLPTTSLKARYKTSPNQPEFSHTSGSFGVPNDLATSKEPPDLPP